MVQNVLTLALLAAASIALAVEPETKGPNLGIRGLKVKRSCESGSWKTTRETYTTISNTQPIARGISGPSRILMTEPRRQSWSSNISLSFEEAKSLNTGLELIELAEDATEKEWIAKEEENGAIGFTAILECKSGTAKCNGGEVSGNICTPKVKQGSGGAVLEGEWGFVQMA